MITFKNTVAGYHKGLIHTGELELKPGKLYTLIGRNGIGKTTLLNTLLGLIPPFEGKVLINGRNIHDISLLERAKLVAHVPSGFSGVQHLSTRDYIAMGRAPYTNFLGKPGIEDLRIVEDTIEQLNMQHLAQKDTSKLSDGERQIASIAKALAQKTPLILLDEPTAFLDYANRMSVLALLRKIAHESDICILQTSHDLELCLEFSDELLVIAPEHKRIHQIINNHIPKQQIIDIAFT